MARDFEKELKALEDKKKKIKEDQLKYEVRCLKPIAESAVDVFGEGLKNMKKDDLKVFFERLKAAYSKIQSQNGSSPAETGTNASERQNY